MPFRIDQSDGASLRRGFLSHAARDREAPAFLVRGITRTYGELEDASRRWAGAMLSNLDAPPERIGIFAYRSEVAYTGTLAALMAGATFVPLNPTFPPEKTAAMIREADLDAVIVDKSAAPQLAATLGDNAPLLLAPEFEAAQLSSFTRVLDHARLESHAPLAELPPLTPSMTAYLLFTSGSTGKPKGVPVTHGNASHFIDVMSRRYQIRPDDRLTQAFDQTFDLSVFDIFMAWHNGASFCSMATVDLLAPAKFVQEKGITVWFSVPSVPAQMLRRNTLKPGIMPGLRWSLFCGEPLPRRSAEAWQAAAPNSVVENLYGPTELTIACFTHRWDPTTSPALCRNDLVPIGTPLEGLTSVIMNEQQEQMADSEPGELCVAGPQTTPGYWREPAKTAERYVDIAISRHESRRFYRTGDRVERLPTGDLAFIGRTDNQVKILGHRVELGEIESVLRQNADVEHAIAVAWPMVETSAQGIVAFVSGNDVDAPALLANARTLLPAYMVPQRVIMMTTMPLNPNGKVDRNALRDQLVQEAATAPAGRK